MNGLCVHCDHGAEVCLGLLLGCFSWHSDRPRHENRFLGLT